MGLGLVMAAILDSTIMYMHKYIFESYIIYRSKWFDFYLRVPHLPLGKFIYNNTILYVMNSIHPSIIHLITHPYIYPYIPFRLFNSGLGLKQQLLVQVVLPQDTWEGSSLPGRGIVGLGEIGGDMAAWKPEGVDGFHPFSIYNERRVNLSAPP